MVATPWGDSSSLRERRLKPGPGTSPEEVAKNQRERLFGATVAAVSKLGYEATRVADLVEISGVSSRSFYDLFPNKEACFVATLKEILAFTAAALISAGDGDIPWDERAKRTSETYTSLVAAQPAAARFIISEAYAAGPVARAALDESMAAFEEMARVRFGQSKERAGMPAEVITAQIGAQQEVTRTRLREGTPQDLADDMPTLMDFWRLYRPPSMPLRMTTRVPSFGPESIDAHDDAERALRAFALVVAEHGFSGATIHEVSRRGSMSPTTFYANFRDKNDALLGAIDSLMAQLCTVALTTFHRSPEWAAGVRAAIGSMLNFLASRPAMANLLLVEVFAGGGEALARRARAASPLADILSDGFRTSPRVPTIGAEAIGGGLAALARKQMLASGPESLPALAPVCAYFVLCPFLGSERAAEAASGDGRGRLPAGSTPPLSRIAVPRTKWTVQSVLATAPSTVAGLAAELGASTEEIEGYLHELEHDGFVESIDSGEDVRWFPSLDYRQFGREEWASLPDLDRERISRQIVDASIGSLQSGSSSGSILRRMDTHLSNLIVTLDEQGWKEMMDIHFEALQSMRAVQLKSVKRLRESEEQPIFGRSLQSLFELDDDQGDAEVR